MTAYVESQAGLVLNSVLTEHPVNDDVICYYHLLQFHQTVSPKFLDDLLFVFCVKSVLLYGCETWLVTSETRRKIQIFVNRCLRYILTL